jgi:hypothetical protein
MTIKLTVKVAKNQRMKNKAAIKTIKNLTKYTLFVYRYEIKPTYL